MTADEVKEIAQAMLDELSRSQPVSPQSPVTTVAALPEDEYFYTREPEALPDRTKAVREALANFRQAVFQLTNIMSITREDERGAVSDRDMAMRGMKETMQKFLSELESYE